MPEISDRGRTDPRRDGAVKPNRDTGRCTHPFPKPCTWCLTANPGSRFSGGMNHAGSTADLPALAQDLAQRALRAIPDWPVMEMAHLYEETDALASCADQQGQSAIADAAVEMTVYLSSLIETGGQASPAQRDRVTALAHALAAAGGQIAVAQAAPSAAPKPDQRKFPVVLYVRPDDRDLTGLSQQLGHERYVVQSIADANRALAEARNRTPDAVIVDIAMVALLPRLLDSAERGSGSERRRPLALVLNDGGDVRQRLFAERAGADAVIEGASAEKVVQRLTALVVSQHRDDARILIVDDDRDMAMFCESVLRYKGMTTQIAVTAQAALAAVAEFRPDLVLLDLYLPDMNGIEVAQLIRERPDMTLVPIIFMSGEDDLDKRFDAIRMGGDDFLEKPIKPRHLIASVSSRVGRSRLLAATAFNSGRPQATPGRVDRATLVHEVECARRGELGECVGLGLLAVDDVPKLARRLGFIRTGDLSQAIIAALALDPSCKAGICVLGEFTFLLLLPVTSEGLLKIAGDHLRKRLQSRGWLSSESPVEVSFTLAVERIDESSVAIDDVLLRLSAEAQSAQEQGGGQTQWLATPVTGTSEVPEQKLARALLRHPLTEATTRIEFRSLVPMRGRHAGQFLAQLSLVAPRTHLVGAINAKQFVPIARELNMLKKLDHWWIDAVCKRIAVQLAKQGETRVLVPISVDSLAEPAFVDWLVAELKARAIDADSLALMFSVQSLLDDVPRSSRLLEQLQFAGTRICLTGFTSCEHDQLRLARLPSTYANVISLSAIDPLHSEPWPELRRKLIAESLRYGKIVVIERVDSANHLGELLKDNVHYVFGDAVGAFSAEMIASEIHLG